MVREPVSYIPMAALSVETWCPLRNSTAQGLAWLVQHRKPPPTRLAQKAWAPHWTQLTTRQHGDMDEMGRRSADSAWGSPVAAHASRSLNATICVTRTAAGSAFPVGKTCSRSMLGEVGLEWQVGFNVTAAVSVSESSVALAGVTQLTAHMKTWFGVILCHLGRVQSHNLSM